jgi:hypothetical protein
VFDGEPVCLCWSALFRGTAALVRRISAMAMVGVGPFPCCPNLGLTIALRAKS